MEKKQVVLLIFFLNLKFLGWSCSGCIRKAKIAAFSDDFCVEITLMLLYSFFVLIHYGTNASEEVEKIIRDKKKLSQIILVLYNLHSRYNKSLIKNVVKSFLNFLQLTGANIYNGYPKLKSAFEFLGDSMF